MKRKLVFLFLAIGIIIFPSVISAQAGGQQNNQTLTQATPYTDPNCWSQVNLILTNNSESRFTIKTGPLEGLSLKANQTSQKKKILCTGEYIFAVRFDKEADNVSTGKKLSFAVCDKIVAEKQDSLTITKFDLNPVGIGKKLKKILRNDDSADKYTLIGGDNEGEVIPSYSDGVRLTLNKGWNILVLQYLNGKGNPTQVTILFMVSDDSRPMMIKRNDNYKSPDNPDGLSIVDWQKPEKKK